MPESPLDRSTRAIYQTAGLGAPAGASQIDELVFSKLKEKGITPAAPCSDGAFVRRVYLDVIGRIPTAREAKAFLKDTGLNKRAILIDRLLEREEFEARAAKAIGAEADDGVREEWRLASTAARPSS